MLSISPPKQAQDAMAYFAAHLRPAAFAGETTVPTPDVGPGTWHGTGAVALGLAGPVTAETLAPLLIGVDQNGQRLVQNAGHPDRRAAWDFVFSSPKSVSVLWALGEAELAEQVASAHRAAVVQAIQAMEAGHAIGRRGKSGKRKEPAGLVVALFHHCTSRENDPQLHDHALVLNLAGFADGRWGALETRPLFQATLEIGARYRAELASQLEGIGLTLEPDGDSFRVSTVSKTLERCFSRRRQQVEAQLNAWGSRSARAAEIATLMTRPEKRAIPLAELRHLWRLRAAAVGGAEIETTENLQPAPTFPALSRRGPSPRQPGL